MDVGDIVQTVIDEIDEYPESVNGHYLDYQEVKSCQKWALKEIMKELEWNDRIPASAIISDFANKMEEFACHDTPSSYLFSIARDMALCMLDMILSY